MDSNKTLEDKLVKNVEKNNYHGFLDASSKYLHMIKEGKRNPPSIDYSLGLDRDCSVHQIRFLEYDLGPEFTERIEKLKDLYKGNLPTESNKSLGVESDLDALTMMLATEGYKIRKEQIKSRVHKGFFTKNKEYNVHSNDVGKLVFDIGILEKNGVYFELSTKYSNFEPEGKKTSQLKFYLKNNDPKLRKSILNELKDANEKYDKIKENYQRSSVSAKDNDSKIIIDYNRK